MTHTDNKSLVEAVIKAIDDVINAQACSRDFYRHWIAYSGDIALAAADKLNKQE